MSNNNKGRNRWHGATPQTSGSRHDTEADPLAGWFSLAKSSRINRQQKRRMQRGRR